MKGKFNQGSNFIPVTDEKSDAFKKIAEQMKMALPGRFEAIDMTGWNELVQKLMAEFNQPVETDKKAAARERSRADVQRKRREQRGGKRKNF